MPSHFSVEKVKHAAYLGAMEDEVDVLDAVGLLCPLPVLKAAKRLKALPAGAVLEVCADDPAAVVDIPHFCAEAGHRLIGQSEEDGVQTYRIQKGTGGSV